MFELTKDLLVGIQDVDDQHRELLGTINDLLAMDFENTDHAIIEESLEFLEKYCLMHFSLERELMDACSYTAVGLHQNQHDLFVDKFLEYKDSFVAENYCAKQFTNFAQWLVKWVVNHITACDMEFSKIYLEKMDKIAKREEVNNHES